MAAGDKKISGSNGGNVEIAGATVKITASTVELLDNGNKISLYPSPVGTVTAYIPGYFTGSGNAGFSLVGPSGNDITSVNSLLNATGWYVCDGSEVNNPDSPIWNAPGRRLPDLSDGRFLRGATSSGVTGGSDTADISHTHGFTTAGSTASWASATVTTSGGSATFNKNVMNSNQTAHSHGSGSYAALISIDTNSNRLFGLETSVSLYTASKFGQFTAAEGGSYGGAGGGTLLTGSSSNATVSWASSTVTTSFTQPNFNKNSLNTNQNTHNHSGTTNGSSVSSVNTIPKFLSCFYIVKVF